MVNLAENSDLVEDLVSAFGVSKLGNLDSHNSSIFKNAFVDFTIATGTEYAISREVVCCFFYLFASEDLCSFSSTIGVEYLFTLSGQAVLGFFDASVAFVE